LARSLAQQPSSDSFKTLPGDLRLVAAEQPPGFSQSFHSIYQIVSLQRFRLNLVNVLPQRAPQERRA